MALKDELESEVRTIFRSPWSTRDGHVVPASESIGLGNDATIIEGTVLYADLADSTKLVDGHSQGFAAEVYKSFLLCAAKIIRSEGGEITAYDGDRVMTIYLGDSKNTSAVRTAMKLHWAVRKIIQPALNAQYSTAGFEVKHVVGIDTSSLFAARTGIRGSNDLVWIGRAANYAAKLAALPDSHQKYITQEIYENMSNDVKFSDGQNMWEAVRWNTFDNRIIYRSTWWWPLS